MRIILASTSKYRQALFQRLAVPFESHAPNVDEDLYKELGLSLVELTQKLASLKAQDVFQRFPDALVIGSDQAVGFDHLIFSKPGHKQKALSQLLELSGKTHRLVTSVCFKSSEKEVIISHETKLKMKSLSAEELLNYIERDKPFDCAGSYKIEEHGINLFEEIECSDFNSIVGLPLIETSRILEQQFGIQPFKS